MGDVAGGVPREIMEGGGERVGGRRRTAVK